MNLDRWLAIAQLVVTLALLGVVVWGVRVSYLQNVNQPTYYSAREASKVGKWCVMFEGVPASDDHPMPTFSRTTVGALDDVVREARRDLPEEDGPWDLVDWWEIKGSKLQFPPPQPPSAEWPRP